MYVSSKENRHICGALSLDRFVSSGGKLAAVRRALGVKQRELAEWLGMSQANLSRLELGSRQLRVDELMHAAAFLNVDPSSLLPDQEPTSR